MTTFDLTTVTSSHNTSSTAQQLTASTSINNGSSYHLLDSDREPLIKTNTSSLSLSSTVPISTSSVSSSSSPSTSSASLGTIIAAVCGSMNSWFRHYRIYKTILLILLLLVLLPLFAHRSLLNVRKLIYALNGVKLIEILFSFLVILKPDNDVPQLDLHRARPLLDAYEDFSSMRASDLKMRIEELLRIKVSFEWECLPSGKVFSCFFITLFYYATYCIQFNNHHFLLHFPEYCFHRATRIRSPTPEITIGYRSIQSENRRIKTRPHERTNRTREIENFS